MKIIIAVVAYMLLAGNIYSQVLKKYPVGGSGCQAYFYCDPGSFEIDQTPDSSDVYNGQCTSGAMTYGIICVKMKGKISELQKSEDVLISYLDYLKISLNITKARGYSKGYKLKNNESTRGVVDYWEDKDNTRWKIKGWTNGKYIVFMFVNSAKPLNETKGDVFLNGLVFPAKAG